MGVNSCLQKKKKKNTFSKITIYITNFVIIFASIWIKQVVLVLAVVFGKLLGLGVCDIEKKK